jgi:catalase
VLDSAGVSGTPGVVDAKSGTETLAAVSALMAAHRVWERFPASIS